MVRSVALGQSPQDVPQNYVVFAHDARASFSDARPAATALKTFTPSPVALYRRRGCAMPGCSFSFLEVMYPFSSSLFRGDVDGAALQFARGELDHLEAVQRLRRADKQAHRDKLFAGQIR